MKKNPSITHRPRPEGVKPRSPAAIALSVALFPIWFPFWAYGVFLAAQFDRTRDFSKWLYGRYECYRYGGFTLIELSIVLVIIGLIVGGVLTGRDLIGAAAVRAQITQVEKFNAAANTFFGKYGALPGDIPAGPAQQFGFVARGSSIGEGDGNGIIQGCQNGYGVTQSCGETALFWVDLSTAKLIEGNFSAANAYSTPAYDLTPSSFPYSLGSFFPQAKIGNGNYIYAYSSGKYTGSWVTDGRNYFGLSVATVVPAATYRLNSTPGLTVSQASAIDRKIDDGFPQTGQVTAVYMNSDIYWTDGTDVLYSPPNTAATNGSSTTCYDNGGNSSNPMAYSVTQNNGSGVNCALSFRMQAGD